MASAYGQAVSVKLRLLNGNGQPNAIDSHLALLLPRVVRRTWVRVYENCDDAGTLNSADLVRWVKMMMVGNAPQAWKGGTELQTYRFYARAVKTDFLMNYL